MIPQTVRTLGETKEHVEPAAQSRQGPRDVFFSAASVAETRTRENITSDDDATRARTALQNDQALILL